MSEINGRTTTVHKVTRIAAGAVAAAAVVAGTASMTGAATASAPSTSTVRVAAAAAPAHSALAAALDQVADQNSLVTPNMNHNRL